MVAAHHEDGVSMEPRSLPDRFLVALTFSGNERDLMAKLAEALEAQLGRGTVYYDNWYRHYFVGHNADLQMQAIYGERAELIVLGISGSYASKEWPQVEFEVVRSLRMRLGQSPDERDRYRILPLRVGDGDVPGIWSNTVAVDARKEPLQSIVELVIDRLRLACPGLRVADDALGGRPSPSCDAGTPRASGAALLVAQDRLARRLTGGQKRFDLHWLDLTLVLVPSADDPDRAFWCTSAPVGNRHLASWTQAFGDAVCAEPGGNGALKWSAAAVGAMRPLLQAEELDLPDPDEAASLAHLCSQDRQTLIGLGIQSAPRNYWQQSAAGLPTLAGGLGEHGALVLVSKIQAAA